MALKKTDPHNLLHQLHEKIKCLLGSLDFRTIFCLWFLCPAIHIFKYPNWEDGSKLELPLLKDDITDSLYVYKLLCHEITLFIRRGWAKGFCPGGHLVGHNSQIKWPLRLFLVWFCSAVTFLPLRANQLRSNFLRCWYERLNTIKANRFKRGYVLMLLKLNTEECSNPGRNP